jgi:hypothetical protein
MLGSVQSINQMNINTHTGGAVPTVALAVTSYGDFGDRLSMSATVDGVAPGDRCDILAAVYRGRSVAWITLPLGADRNAVAAAVLAKADWYLGSRCPDMANYPLAFD